MHGYLQLLLLLLAQLSTQRQHFDLQQQQEAQYKLLPISSSVQPPPHWPHNFSSPPCTEFNLPSELQLFPLATWQSHQWATSSPSDERGRASFEKSRALDQVLGGRVCGLWVCTVQLQREPQLVNSRIRGRSTNAVTLVTRSVTGPAPACDGVRGSLGEGQPP